MLHDVSVLIGFVFTLVLIDAHQKFIINDFLQILMRSHASIDKFYQFSHIFLFDNVRNKMWHHFSDSVKIFRFKFNYSSLK